MRRLLFTVASVLSMLMFVATVAMWIQSDWRGEGWRFSSRPSRVSIPYVEYKPVTGDEQRRSDWRAVRVVISAGGKLQLFERDFPANGVKDAPAGRFTSKSVFPVNWTVGGFVPPGERHLRTPLFVFSERPAWADDDGNISAGYRSVVVPWWVPFLLSGYLPAIWAIIRSRQWRQDTRRRQHQCLVCGYNLVGNASGVCPECGTTIPSDRVQALSERV